MLYEAAGQAGGRCRSYFDATLDCVIDNGNHLVLSGNRAVHDYLAHHRRGECAGGTGARGVRFVDIATDERWTIRPNDGPLPWWIFAGDRRVPGTSAGDYAAAAGLLIAGPAARIDDIIPCKGALWERLMRPLLLAALNTEPEKVPPRWPPPCCAKRLAKGGRAYRPRIATPNLAAAFVEPALEYLTGKCAMVHLGQRLRAHRVRHGKHAGAGISREHRARVARRYGGAGGAALGGADLMPGLETPDEFRSIVNAHFKIPAPPGAPPCWA